MDQVQHFHEYLLRQRTQIRNHRRTLQEMKRCWKLVPRADPDAMSREEYEGMYSTLLYEMTICWDEEMNDVVLAKMWQRDASAFSDLDFNRFCCSIFYFAEMWVQEITQDGYTRIFGIIRTILSGHEFAPLSSSTEAADSTFMPTLETFDDAFDREKEMESMNLNIGKSIVFDAKKYFQQFGSPTATIQASNSNLFQLQERSARTVPPRGVLCEDYNRRYGTYESATKTKSGCSNPKLLRPTSSRQARLNSYSSSPTAPPDSPPPNTSRTAGTFLLAGTTALKPTTNM
ncbi:uncharacterized protein IUM83_06805 [Phytophthora cinnamomi]|uniref:uncharacterized protein n=1 Tax=Phytophthora cinnamomi TaxID=4785 RepID=UPI003559F1ED|nr:hypothetical protein IUM83_06805 [Phytophthora cinnamomi]